MNLFLTVFLSLATFLCANPIYHDFDDGDKIALLQDNIMSASLPDTVDAKSEGFVSFDIACESDSIRSHQKRNDACPASSTKGPRPLDDVENSRKTAPQDLQNPATNTQARPFAEDGVCDDHSPHLKHLHCGGPIILRFPFNSVLNCVPCKSSPSTPIMTKVVILMGQDPVKPIPQRHPFRAASKVAEACCEDYTEARNQGVSY